MGWIFFPSEDDVIDVIRREIYSQKTIDKIVVDIEREIHIPPAISSEEIRNLIEQMLNDHHSMMVKKTTYNNEPKFSLGEADLQKISQKVLLNLRQEVHEEISRIQVEWGNTWGKRLKEFEGRIQKLEDSVNKSSQTTPAPPATIDWMSIQNAIKQIQTEEQHIKIRLGQIETRLNSPQSTAVPVGENKATQAEIEGLKKQLLIQSQSYATLKSAFDNQLLENSALKEQLSLQEQRFSSLEKQNSEWKRQLKDLQNQLEQLKGKDIPSVTKPQLQPSVVPPIPSTPPQGIPWIKFFSLIKSAMPVAYFHGDGAIVKSKLSQSIQDMDGLITYLSQSKIEEPARTSFMKNLRWCMEALEKLYGKFDFDGCDQEELSEEITGKFFRIISENLLDNVLVAIYRGGKDATDYQDFLKTVNSYLTIYTEEITPGMSLEGDMLSNIEPPIAKQTPIPADDGKVDEVELLPYFMVYEDDDGNLDTVRKRGRVVRLKYGA